MAYIRKKSEELTGYQARAEFRPSVDLGCDFVIVYGIDDTMPERVRQYREQGYVVHLMTGIAWGEYQDYLDGRWDGSTHWEEGQVRKDGTGVCHNPTIPYMVPTVAFSGYMTERLKTAVDAGVEAIHLEEPEFWDESGYSEAFRREYEIYYREPWCPQHENTDARYRSAKLKAYLYLRTLDRIGTALKEYAKVKYGRDLRFYVPTHSLINYMQWKIISPESALTTIPTVDGYIAQVWTGTSRTANVYEGIRKERTFETAYLEYGAMQELVRGTGRRMWFLNDPIEDLAGYTWEDYRYHYIKTITAALMHPDIWHYEICPWPHRVFEEKYPRLQPGIAEKIETCIETPESRPIPQSYATLLSGMFQLLGDMEQEDITYEGAVLGVGVLVSDSGLFQRTFSDDIMGRDDMGEDAVMMREFVQSPALPQFFGLSMPLLKYGLPIRPVQLDHVRRFAGYLKDCRFLILSYEYIKPESPDVNAALLSWVRAGGCLFYIGDGSDPYHAVSSWWRQAGYENPAQHLFEMAEMERNPADGCYAAGRGTIRVWNLLPARLCLDRTLAQAYRERVKKALSECTMGSSKESPMSSPMESPADWQYRNDLTLRRGPYLISAVMDESVDEKPKIFEGLYADLLENDYRIITHKEIAPDETAILFDFSRIQEEKFRIIGTSARVEEMQDLGGKYYFRLKTADNIRAYLRVRLPRPVVRVMAVDEDGENVPISMDWDERTQTLLLSYDSRANDNHAKAVCVTAYENPYMEHEAYRQFLKLYTGGQRRNPKSWMDYFTSEAFLEVHREPAFTALLLAEVERHKDCPPTREFQTWLRVAYQFTAVNTNWGQKQKFGVTADTDFDGIESIFQIAGKGPEPKRMAGNEQGMSICFSEYHQLMQYAQDGTWKDQALTRARRIIGHYVLSDLTEKCVNKNPEYERHIAGLRLLNNFFGRFCKNREIPEELYRILWEQLSLETATMGRAKLLYGRLREIVMERLPAIAGEEKESYGHLYYSGFHDGGETDPFRGFHDDEADLARKQQETEDFFAKDEVQRALRNRRWVEDYLLCIWLKEYNSVSFLQKIKAFYTENTDAPCAERVAALAGQLLWQKEVKRQAREDKITASSAENRTFDSRPFFRYWLNTGFYGESLGAYLNQNLPFLPDWSRNFLQTPGKESVILDGHVIEVIFHMYYIEYRFEEKAVYQPFLRWTALLELLGEDNHSLFLLLPVTAASEKQYEAVSAELLRRLKTVAVSEEAAPAIAGFLAGHVCCLPDPEELSPENGLFLTRADIPEWFPFEMFAENEQRLYGWNWFPLRGSLVFFEQDSTGRRNLPRASYERLFEWKTALPMAQRILHEIASPARFNLALLQEFPRKVCIKPQYAPEETFEQNEIDQERLGKLLEQYAQGRLERLELTFFWARRSIVFLKETHGYACIFFDDWRDEYLILLSEPERYQREPYSQRKYVPFGMGKLPDYGIHQDAASIMHKLDKVFCSFVRGQIVERQIDGTLLWAVGCIETHARHKYYIARQKLGGFPAEETQNPVFAKFVLSRCPQQIEIDIGERREVKDVCNGDEDKVSQALIKFMGNQFRRLRLTWNPENEGEAWYPFHIVLLQENGRYMMACLRDDIQQADYYVADVRTYLDVEGKRYPKDIFMGRTTPAYLIHSDAQKIRNCLDLIFDDMTDLPAVTGKFAAFASESPVKARTYEEIRRAYVSS